MFLDFRAKSVSIRLILEVYWAPSDLIVIYKNDRYLTQKMKESFTKPLSEIKRQQKMI